MIEKKWPAVAPQLFIIDGSTSGVVNVADARGFKVKQRVVISATGLPSITAQIKRFLSPTQFYVGPLNPKQGQQGLTGRTDLTGYSVANTAYVYAEEQDKAILKPDDILQAVYRQEPGTTIGVEIDDQFGQPIDSTKGSDGKNRLAVDAQVTVTSGGLTPADFDDVKIIRDINELPTQYQFYLLGVLQGVINVTYNANSSAVEYKKA